MSLYVKACAVVASAETREQLSVAARFVRLAYLAEIRRKPKRKGGNARFLDCPVTKAAYKNLVNEIKARGQWAKGEWLKRREY